MAKTGLSVVVSTYNSEKFINGCLSSVNGLADEIIVVDNGSSDKTVQIAQKHTKIIHRRKNNPLVLNKAKNYGFSKAKERWILSLDSDEQVTSKLARGIRRVVNNDVADNALKAGIVAYQMPRKNMIFGKWIKHGLWYPDEQIRLFQNGRGYFEEKHNHEKLTVKGRVGTLSGHLLHHNYTSVTQYLDKINHQYSDNEAMVMINEGKRVRWYDAVGMPLSDFITNFFAREAYKDGLHGFVLSVMQAFYTFVVFAKIWEIQGFKEYNSNTFLKELSVEVNNKQQEIAYWCRQKQGFTNATTKSIVKKIIRFFR